MEAVSGNKKSPKSIGISRYWILFLFFLLTAHCSLLTALHAVPPPPGFTVPSEPTCKMNHSAVKSRAAALKAAPYFPPAILPTTAYVVVIRVDFSDQVMTKTKSETELFFSKLKDFYYENSYGLFLVSATVTNSGSGGQGAYRMPNTLMYYAQGVCSNYDEIAHHSVNLASANGVNFSNGAPGGKPFDHIMIYHAGFGAETSNDSGCKTDNIWSVFAPTVPISSYQNEGVIVPFSAHGVSYNGVTVVPEKENGGIDPLGVICHEYGHQLGLPDLYRSSAESVVGSWSLMDGGIYIGSPAGSNPSHLDAWSKQFLGFNDPQTITLSESPSSFSFNYSAVQRNATVRIPVSGLTGVDGTKEYFLVERRGISGLTGKNYDNALPFGLLNEGYLIWHIDDNIALNESRLNENTINNGSPHCSVDLVEAAGNGVLASTIGKESDFFPGSKGKTIFGAPLSNSFDGRQTGISLSGFSGASLTAVKAFASDTIGVTKVINFPNPGGPLYQQKVGAPMGTVTTIVIQVTRPVQEIKLTIHDLSGSLVRSVTEGAIRANGTATKTNKFAYEYDWDGKNDGGDSVAPGIYLYRFKADDSIVKTGKLVLVR